MIKNCNEIGLTILRIGLSIMMLTHGIPKINLLFNDPIEFADPIGLGSTTSLILTLIGEVIAPVFIIFGFKTKWACIPIIITMFVAAFIVHGTDDLNVKEKAILYLVGYITVLLSGPGKYAIDHK